MNDDRSRCFDAITGLLHKIEDPVHLSNVHDWMIGLTTGEPSSRKSEYLRLLEQTLKSGGGGGVCEPFVHAPPPNVAAAVAEGRTINGWLSAGGSGNGCDSDMDDYYNYDDDDHDKFDTADSGGSVCASAPCAPAPPATRPDLDALMARTDVRTASVQQLLADARAYTCDDGRLMAAAVDEELADFGTAAAAVFEERTQRLSDALAKEQAALLLRYRGNRQRVLCRAQILQDHVRELMPAFQYDDYVAEPDAYLRREVINRLNRNKEPGGAGPERDENEDAVRQKKSLCALNWLRSEVDRADCEYEVLSKRHDAIAAAIGAADEKRIANECHAADRKREMKCQLVELRKQSAKQIALIDSYVEKMSLM